MWLWVVGIVAVVGAVTVVAVGSGASLSEVYEDRPDRTIPVGRPLRSDDLQEVTFTTAVRGYRMDEVDALLARVRADLIAREAHEPGADPDVARPGVRQPGDVDEEAAGPEATGSGAYGYEAADPRAREPGDADEEAAGHGATESGAYDREAAQPPAREPGDDDSEAAGPGAG
jgi:DivIVA domain-containing protein